ncbi:hypothetical protein ACHAXT_002013 [Thalassiosira profunda]
MIKGTAATLALLLQAAGAAFDGLYTLRINASLPLELDWQTGEPEIDRCVEWGPGDNSNGANFTWYGLRIQLPDDATTQSGQYYSDVVVATMDGGFVQSYNATNDTVLMYNLTTAETKPTVRLNFNDNPFWTTYTFDAAGDEYQQYVKEERGSVSCYATPANETSREILSPVIPTLTISLQRLDGEVDPATPAPTPPSSAVVPRGEIAVPFAFVFAAWMHAYL